MWYSTTNVLFHDVSITQTLRTQVNWKSDLMCKRRSFIHIFIFNIIPKILRKLYFALLCLRNFWTSLKAYTEFVCIPCLPESPYIHKLLVAIKLDQTICLQLVVYWRSAIQRYGKNSKCCARHSKLPWPCALHRKASNLPLYNNIPFQSALIVKLYHFCIKTICLWIHKLYLPNVAIFYPKWLSSCSEQFSVAVLLTWGINFCFRDIWDFKTIGWFVLTRLV